jgi:hypothetical protein
MGRRGTTLLGIGLFAIGVLLIYALVVIWPAVDAAVESPPTEEDITFFWGITYEASPDTALILLVAVSSALGSYVHAATSFGDYVGNRKLFRSWMWWYLLRFWIGVAIALIFYFAVRGGFLVATGSTDDLNPYGIAALAGLTGLFSKQATDKLNEVFSTLFRVPEGTGDDARRDSLDEPRPQITSTDPQNVVVGDARALKLLGTGFVEGAIVVVGRPGQEEEEERTTTLVDASTLEVQLEAGDVAVAGTLQLSVVDPSGEVSDPFPLQVTPAEGGDVEEVVELEEGGD